MKRYGVKTFRRMCALALAVMGMLVLTACEGKTDINSVEQSSGQQIAEKNEDNRYTVVELPEELQTGEGIECKFYMRQGDFPYMIIGVKDKDCYIYKSYILTEEDTWEIRELEWSREFAKREKRCIYDLSIDSKGNYYALIREEDEKRNKETLFLYRILVDGSIQNMDLTELTKVADGREYLFMELAGEDRLAFYYYKKDTGEAEKYQNVGILYDVVTEHVLSDAESMDALNCVFDKEKEGVYYYIDYAQRIIVQKKMGSAVPDKVIRCEKIHSMWNCLLVRDGRGYVFTEDGIYGGSLEEDEWTELVLPMGEMYHDKNYKTDFDEYYQQFGFLNKLPGADREFVIETKDKPEEPCKWVRYYE